MQDVPTLLVAVRVEQGEHIRCGRVDHRSLRHHALGQQTRLHRPHVRDQRVATARVLRPQFGEVGRESLRQPDVRPLALGDRVAEPLVRRLVRHEVARDRATAKQVVGVEDRRRVFHPAETCRRLHVRQLLVRERCDERRIERDDSLRFIERRGDPRLRILRDVDRLRDAAPVLPPEASRRRHRLGAKRCRRDHHQVRRDRVALVPPGDGAPGPPRALAAVGPRAVGDDRELGGRIDRPRHRCLVARIVDDGEPVPRALGPVVAERLPAALRILRDDQPVRGHAVIEHRHARTVGRGAERHRDTTRPARELARRAVQLHTVHRQQDVDANALPLGARAEEHLRDAADRAPRVGERQCEVVVNDIDIDRDARWCRAIDALRTTRDRGCHECGAECGGEAERVWRHRPRS